MAEPLEGETGGQLHTPPGQSSSFLMIAAFSACSMPAPVLSALHKLSRSVPRGRYDCSPIYKMRKPRYREAKRLAQSHGLVSDSQAG